MDKRTNIKWKGSLHPNEQDVLVEDQPIPGRSKVRGLNNCSLRSPTGRLDVGLTTAP
jgi:hypothetical protein